jgi:hypothetical protein
MAWRFRMLWFQFTSVLRWIFAVALAFAAVTACSRPAPATPSGEGGWLAGTVDRKFDTVAKHLRGFDMAMVEAGYRYNELYWAAQDENWGYADYQVKKIRTAVENGLERRPKRAPSAATLLKVVLPAVEEAIARRDSALLRERIGALRSTCNSCHQAEKVEFVHVGVPQVRPFTASPQ